MTSEIESGPFRLLLRFWGVRGSTPATGARFSHFGGNTACLEVRLPTGEILIFDGGTGVRALGKSLMKECPRGGLDVQFFLTHFHWDHIQGIPFFDPLFVRGNRLRFYSLREPDEARRLIAAQMLPPYFPIEFGAAASTWQFERTGLDPISSASASIHAFPLNHPQQAVGYRIEHLGARIVYASDLEHGDPELDRVLLANARDADVLIYDAQYTPEEYESKRGWGHSTWLQAARVARNSGVKRLVLIHHDPERDDSALHRLVDLARAEFPFTEAAREGCSIEL
jgi:phosphoribosyl 1,2-cyclic phosphodiesterase